MLPGPFFGWLGMLMFLLLMQFLIKYLPDIVGKGLPFGVIVELIAYNLAYMLVLAVPMSVLIASLMAFGRIAESNAYAVMKSAGASPMQLVWPAVLIGILLSGGMMYFNNEVLPEANFRAKNLWQDIRRKKPGFQLQPGVFYNGLNGYSILIRQIPPGSDELVDILVYDYTAGAEQPVTIKAARGYIEPSGSGDRMDLLLRQGELHRQVMEIGYGAENRYERLAFDTYRMQLDLSDFSFERSNPREGYRSDRTMRTIDMVRIVDSLRMNIDRMRADLRHTLVLTDDSTTHDTYMPAIEVIPTDTLRVQRGLLAGLTAAEARAVVSLANQRAESSRMKAEELQRSITTLEQPRVDRYLVEVHKKISIAVACLIFMIVGAPLGLSIRRGGLGTAGALAIGIFLFYWVTLVQGEKLADRGYLPPWIGMWIANIVVLGAALWGFVYQTLDLGATPGLLTRVLERFARPVAVRSDPPAVKV